jgi:hypothetical protein
MFKLRFCVGDRFYLCDNQILCEYDYEERLVFANLAAAKQRQQLQDDETQFNRPANPPPASAAALTSSSAAASLLSSVRILMTSVLLSIGFDMTTKSLNSDGWKTKNKKKLLLVLVVRLKGYCTDSSSSSSDSITMS